MTNRVTAIFRSANITCNCGHRFQCDMDDGAFTCPECGAAWNLYIHGIRTKPENPGWVHRIARGLIAYNNRGRGKCPECHDPCYYDRDEKNPSSVAWYCPQCGYFKGTRLITPDENNA